MRTRYGRNPKTLEAKLAPLRRGRAGQVRSATREALIHAMGFANARDVPEGYAIPHRFPRQNPPAERREWALVALDGLLELGYEASVSRLTASGDDPHLTSDYLPLHAKEALELLEAGPPSILIDSYPVFMGSIRRCQIMRYGTPLDCVVGKLVGEGTRPWYLFRSRCNHPSLSPRRGRLMFVGAYKTLTELKTDYPYLEMRARGPI